MGTIILLVGVSIALAFLSGMFFTLMNDSHNDNYALGFMFTMCCLILSICLSIKTTQEYYEKKEYSSVKYELKKKVIRIEEDNTAQLDTVYTFTHK